MLILSSSSLAARVAAMIWGLQTVQVYALPRGFPVGSSRSVLPTAQLRRVTAAAGAAARGECCCDQQWPLGYAQAGRQVLWKYWQLTGYLSHVPALEPFVNPSLYSGQRSSQLCPRWRTRIRGIVVALWLCMKCLVSLLNDVGDRASSRSPMLAKRHKPLAKVWGGVAAPSRQRLVLPRETPGTDGRAPFTFCPQPLQYCPRSKGHTC